ncbi:Mitochondrial ribonuclease P protein 1-like protein, partial [Stegodyphus mimosarum]
MIWSVILVKHLIKGTANLSFFNCQSYKTVQEIQCKLFVVKLISQRFRCSGIITNHKNAQRFKTSELHPASYTDMISEINAVFPVVIEEIQKALREGKRIPEYLTMQQIEELLNVETKSGRLKYLAYLFKKEKIKLSDLLKKERKRNLRLNRTASLNDESQPSHIQYGLGRNSLLLRLEKRTMNQFYNLKLANALLFGQKIVIDLDYDDYMRQKERRDCAAQLRLLYSINRENHFPYDLYFCNAKPSYHCVQYLRQEMPNIDDSFINLTEQSYVDIFPKEKLIYLSPHATESLKTYDHSAIYIIGGFVDIVKKKQISVDKAKEVGIKSYSLPLDDHIVWGLGSRSLSINQVFEIMMTMKNTGNWKKAFQYVPSRK